jgi:hypothetical protein
MESDVIGVAGLVPMIATSAFAFAFAFALYCLNSGASKLKIGKDQK